MRNGYLPLLMPELTAERLQQAGLLVSIAPARPFSAAERMTIRGFVESGGVFLCMVGAEQVAGSRDLLDDFNLRVRPSPVPPGDESGEVEPMGWFRTLYFNTGAHKAQVQFYAGWPVEGGQETLVLGFGNRPIVARTPLGHGSVVLIGDTYFAVNQNLESATYQMQENIHFWRWLLARVVRHENWVPPRAPQPESGEAPEDATEDAAGTPTTDSNAADSSGATR